MDRLITIRRIKPDKLALCRGAPRWSNHTLFNAPFVFQMSSIPLQPSTTRSSGLEWNAWPVSVSGLWAYSPCLLLVLVRGTKVLVQWISSLPCPQLPLTHAGHMTLLSSVPELGPSRLAAHSGVRWTRSRVEFCVCASISSPPPHPPTRILSSQGLRSATGHGVQCVEGSTHFEARMGVPLLSQLGLKAIVKRERTFIFLKRKKLEVFKEK